MTDFDAMSNSELAQEAARRMEIPLTKGVFSRVSQRDYESLSKWAWSFHNGYAVRYVHENGKTKTISMHAEIMGVEDGLWVDHRDGDGLNNQRENLRACTPSQNNANRKVVVSASGYKGVSLDKRRIKRPWNASIKINRKKLFIGAFRTAEDAESAYDAKAIELFGEFALTNASMRAQ